MEVESEQYNVNRKGEKPLQNNVFEKIKLKSNDIFLSWNPEYNREESGIQGIGIRLA